MDSGSDDEHFVSIYKTLPESQWWIDELDGPATELFAEL